MQQPQWAEVPNWVNWMAQDSDGIWWGYEAKPDLLDRGFGRLNGTRFGSELIILLQHGRPVRRWRDSLQSRPV